MDRYSIWIYDRFGLFWSINSLSNIELMDTQEIIVYLLFTAAIFWLGMRFYKTYSLKKAKSAESNKVCGSDSCGCNG
jgi:hypothetical protein